MTMESAKRTKELKTDLTDHGKKRADVWEDVCVRIAELSGGSWQREFAGIRVTITKQDA